MNEETDVKKQVAGACGPGCGCGTSAPGGRGRMVIGAVVLIVAGALVVRAVIKDNEDQAADDKAPVGFAALPAPVTEPAKTPEAKTAQPTDTLQELESLSELNSVAGDKFGVFVFLPGRGETAVKAPMAQLRSAARTIEPQLRGGKIGMFALKAGSRDYEMISAQVSVPGVIVLVPGGRMVPVTGEITETKLIQGFLSSVQSCGAGGCGPRGCG